MEFVEGSLIIIAVVDAVKRAIPEKYVNIHGLATIVVASLLGIGFVMIPVDNLIVQGIRYGLMAVGIITTARNINVLPFKGVNAVRAVQSK